MTARWRKEARKERKAIYRKIAKKRPYRKERTRPNKLGYSDEEERLWRAIDGAVLDAFTKHPHYLSGSVPLQSVQQSVCKRVIGAVRAFRKERVGPGTDPGD